MCDLRANIQQAEGTTAEGVRTNHGAKEKVGPGQGGDGTASSARKDEPLQAESLRDGTSEAATIIFEELPF